MATPGELRESVLPVPARTPRAPGLSVVIPTLDEAARIESAVASAWNAGAAEVVVADGGSTDGTPSLAARCARVVTAPRGRAAQMNAGAAAASGDTLLFLHADSLLPAGAATRVARALSDPEVGGGAFRMRIDAPGPWWRAASALAAARTRLLGTVLGDQAIFCRASLFHALGGYAPLPILEDLDFAQRLRRRARFELCPEEVRTSDRRWRKHGRIRTSLINWTILALHAAGASPETLVRLYR